MEVEFTIPGRLDGFNDYVRACRSGAQVGAEAKRRNERIVKYYVTEQLKGIRFEKPVKITIDWYEKDGRRDPDNICGFGHKVILDALVKGRVLKDDSRKYVIGLEDRFYVDPKNPRIEITISEGGS